jgi:hypothetical protein
LTLAERVAQSRRDAPEGEDTAEPTPLKAEAVTDGKLRDERVVDEAATAEAEPQASGSERRTPRIKSRLLDRISDLSKA